MTVNCMTAASLLVMWLADQITQRGIGNGTSLIIMINITSRLPVAIIGAWTRYFGLGGISVAIYDHKSVLVAKVATEEDGFYSYLGLKPGKYTARIEDAELDRAGMERGAAPAIFMIKSSKEGDLAGHQDFLLQPRK